MAHNPTSAPRRTIPGYTSQYLDPVSGGYPLGNGYRLYLPQLRRFTAPDSMSPFGPGGPNPYVYCGDDPVNRYDPSGHMNISAAFGAFKNKVGALLPRPGERMNDIGRDATQENQTQDNPIAAMEASSADEPGTSTQDTLALAPPPRRGTGAWLLSHHMGGEPSRARSQSDATVQLGNRQTMGEQLQKAAANAKVGDYPTDVILVNELLHRWGVKISVKFESLVRNNVKEISDGEKFHASASMSEMGGLASDALNAPISPRTRSATIAGVPLQFFATTVHAQTDLADYTGNNLSATQRIAMMSYESGNPHSL